MALAVGVETLEWNQSMASYGEDYANIRAVDCEFNHSMEPNGENISEGSNKSLGSDACFGRSNFITKMMKLLGFRIWN